MSITTNCVINQVMKYFLANCFTFRTQFWMLQVIKLDSCGIPAIFFQCCFMIETKVLMRVSDFLEIFSRNHFLEWGFTLQWGSCFSYRGASFLSGGAPWGASILMGGFQKTVGGGVPPPHTPPHYGKPCQEKTSLLFWSSTKWNYVYIIISYCSQPLFSKLNLLVPKKPDT